MARRLTGFVVLMSPVTFQAEKFGPDDDVPEWAAERITSPGLWVGGDNAATTAPGKTEVAEPPRAGRGASAAAWRSHVEALGLERPAGATREELIALVDARD